MIVIAVSVVAELLALFAPAIVARADIFQWEYINPANPSQGKQPSTMLCSDGAGAYAGPATNLANRNLSMAYLIGADLSADVVTDVERNVIYYTAADLSGVNLSGADVQGANFYAARLTGANLSHANLKNAKFWGGDLYSDIPGADLTDANLGGADARAANFGGATLTSANFTDAQVGGANFASSQITKAQIYSTASYQAHDLSGIKLSGNYAGIDLVGQNLTHASFFYATLSGANLSQANATNADFSTYSTSNSNLTGANLGQANLTNADFRGYELEDGIILGANLTNANLSGADSRGANFQYATLTGATTTNLIQSNGHIAGLNLTSGESLTVRDYDGNPAVSPPIGPIPIVVDGHLAMNATSTLRLVFDADPWNSTISFAPGIPVARGGTLELMFSQDVNLASQVGRTIDLFDWTGVNPTGAFTVSSPYTWNLSKLYTTGEVTLTSQTPTPGDYNNNGVVDAADYVVWRKNYGTQTSYDTWRAHFGQPSGAGIGASASANAAVPEPATTVLLILTAAGLCLPRHRAT
jgi:uncharacterized protein YjbI with pentapeptide repeats